MKNDANVGEIETKIVEPNAFVDFPRTRILNNTEQRIVLSCEKQPDHSIFIKVEGILPNMHKR